MDEKNNKKAYLIIGICCLVALVIGLFTGKTISDKAKYDAALAYIESAQQNQVVEADNSGDNEVSEVSDASVTQDIETVDVQAIVEKGRDYWYGMNGKRKDNDKAKEQFESALEQNENDGRALYYLGEIERYKENYSVAKEYYEKAISAGEPLAALALGYLYQNGDGVGKDYKKAMELYEQAISDGCVEANVGIGDFYQSGYDGYETDGFKAIEYFEKATDGEEPEWVSYAYVSIATIYADEGDEARAEEWYKKRFDALKTFAEAGDADAMNEIGYMYQMGRGVEQDYAKAFEWYEKAVGEGNSDAMANMGFLYHYGNGVEQDYAKAFECYEKAADKGVPVAMNQIGIMYGNGEGVEQDYAKAAEWYEKAANAGDEIGMRNIALMYQMGRGVEQDYAKAIEWYEKAADVGSADNLISIAVMYYMGDGVEQDYAKAMEWFEKAADAGSADAMDEIAYMYENGLGVTKDEAKAKEWREKAAEAAQTN